VIKAQGRHLAPAELLARQQPAVASDHLELGIDQHRHIKAKSLDARAICRIWLSLCRRGFAGSGFNSSIRR
jgi:hypothetical protein